VHSAFCRALKKSLVITQVLAAELPIFISAPAFVVLLLVLCQISTTAIIMAADLLF